MADVDDLIEDLREAAEEVWGAEQLLRGQLLLDFMNAVEKKKRPRRMAKSKALEESEYGLCRSVRRFQHANTALKRASEEKRFRVLRREILEGLVDCGILDFLRARCDEDVLDVAHTHRQEKREAATAPNATEAGIACTSAEELAELRARLGRLQEVLVDHELELATLRRELSDFRARYLGIVGARLAELDVIEAEIAAAIAAQEPTEDSEATLREAQWRATQSFEALGDDSEMLAEAARDRASETPESLKQLYRTVAKAVHPDFAIDNDDRQVRERAMAEANEAYAAGDERRLSKILRDWRSHFDWADDVASRGERAQLAQAVAATESRIQAIVDELAQVKSQDIYLLFEEERHARQEGRELLSEMEAKVSEQVKRAKARRQRLAECEGISI